MVSLCENDSSYKMLMNLLINIRKCFLNSLYSLFIFLILFWTNVYYSYSFFYF